MLQIEPELAGLTELQLILFLVNSELDSLNARRSHYFVPGESGPVSFEAMGDLKALTTLGYLDEEGLNDRTLNWLDAIEPAERVAIERARSAWQGREREEMLAMIFRSFPYYAINAPVRHAVLSADELERVESERPIKSGSVLFTIGYEGRHLEEYLNALIGEDVHLLIDVRKNAYSMKYGFSRHTFEPACGAVRIRYVHLSGLGVDQRLRHAAQTVMDWQRMFELYEREILPEHGRELLRIKELMKEESRAAITCYERLPVDCHRSRVAKALAELRGWTHPIVDL